MFGPVLNSFSLNPLTEIVYPVAPVESRVKSDFDSQHPAYKTVLLSPPALAFLQIQNKDNDKIVLLAPPCPWWRRKCFAAAAAVIICSNGSWAMANDKGTTGEGAVFSSKPFDTLLMTNCMICCCARASSPMTAAEAL